ncbi:MAG: hypothetical protein H6Q05_51 [Acidobacteria bacterium]|nr:hypothetical protein [Acidobacteriota bacterium]
MTNDPIATDKSRLAIVFFLACFAAVTYFMYRILSPFLSVLAWAAVLAVVFYPLFKRILPRVRRRRTAAASITCLLVLLLIVLPVTFLGVIITQQSIAFYQDLQQQSGSLAGVTAHLKELQRRPTIQYLAAQAQKWLGAGELNIEKYLQDAASNVSRFLVGRGPSFLRGVGEMIFHFFLMFISMFFLLRDGPQLLETIRSSNPLPAVYEAEIIKRFEDVTYATFFGSLLTAVVQGIAACLLFLSLGLPAPLFWGAVVSLMSLVPIVGALIVWLPWTAYLILAGHTTRGIVLLAVGTLVVGSIDNVLKPMIIQGRTDMHPLLVFFSVLGGLKAFGFLGVLLGPLIVALFVSFLNFYRFEFREILHTKRPVTSGPPP